MPRHILTVVEASQINEGLLISPAVEARALRNRLSADQPLIGMHLELSLPDGSTEATVIYALAINGRIIHDAGGIGQLASDRELVQIILPPTLSFEDVPFQTEISLIEEATSEVAQTRTKYDVLRDCWTFFESCIGLFAVFVMGFGPPVVMGLFGLGQLLSDPADRELPVWIFFGGMLLTGASAMWTAWIASDAFNACFPEAGRSEVRGQQNALGWPPMASGLQKGMRPPLAVVMARGTPRMPLALGLLLSLWWLAHGAIGFLTHRFVGQWIAIVFADSSIATRIFAEIAVLFSISFANNVYILLGLGIFERRLTVLKNVWRWRIAIDVMQVLVIIVF